MTRSRRAGQPRAQDRHRPLYARLLGLTNLTPSGFLCFVFLEGTIALGALLALAELVSWWGVLVLPLTVAVMVKLNDVIAGAVSPPAAVPAPRVVSSTAVGWASSVPETGRDPVIARTWTDVSGVNGPVLRSPTAPPPESGWPPRAGDQTSLGRPHTVEVGLPRHGTTHGWTAAPVATAVGTNDPVPWTEQLDNRLQRERHSASRRYE